MTWTTGVVATLVLPLVILLVAHGVVSIPLQDAQGAVIFLFFGWVTTSQAMFTLYRLPHRGLLDCLVDHAWGIGGHRPHLPLGRRGVYHFLYPAHDAAASFMRAAEWNRSLFDAVVGLAVMFILAAWGMIYGKGQRRQVADARPGWISCVHGPMSCS